MMAADAMPAPAMTMGGSGSPASAGDELDSTKYDARPTAAPSAHSTPARSTRCVPVRSSTSTSPPSASTPPTVVNRLGRCPCTSHIQSTTSNVPQYSSSSATPTERCCTALKKNSWGTATAVTP